LTNSLDYDVQASGPSDNPAEPEETSASDSGGVGPLDSGMVQHFAQNDFEGGSVLFGQSRAIADYTVLRGFAEAFLRGDGGAAGTALFSANANDVITVDSPGLAGQNGTYRLTYFFDGSISGDDTNTNADATLSIASGREFAESTVTEIGNPFSETVNLDIPIVFGEAFQTSVALSGSVEAPQDFGGTNSTTVDVLNSATLNSIVLLNGSGTPVNGTVSGNSGAGYNQFVVPEPSPVLLTILGLAGFLARRRRA